MNEFSYTAQIRDFFTRLEGSLLNLSQKYF